MRNNIEIYDVLRKLTKISTGEEITGINTLPLSGSSRHYYRIFTDNQTIIGVFNDNIEENEAFFTFTEHFYNIGLAVPKLLAVNEGRDIYLQEDLGDDNLFNHVKKCLDNGVFDDETINLYKDVLSHLVVFQIDGHKGLDYSVAMPTPCFDVESILEDLNYFKYCFLKIHSEIVFNEVRLNADFKKLAMFLAEAPSDFFMYRDFQSRNIMIKGGKPFFIDYQGGRKGPLQYDVASLLYQVKACLPQKLRDELVRHYKMVLSERLDMSSLNFDNYFQAFVVLRLMQVLGAYGFRGLLQKKAHFIESISYAVDELTKQTEALKLPFVTPELDSVFSQFYKLHDKYKKEEYNGLTVTISSFSFRDGGCPVDFSGNGGGFVFDCRILPNPGRIDMFKSHTGLDKDVQEFIEKIPEAMDFFSHVKEMVTLGIDTYRTRGFNNLMINFGCTGGQHRSVYFAQKTAEYLVGKYSDVKVVLRHLAQQKYHVFEPVIT